MDLLAQSIQRARMAKAEVRPKPDIRIISINEHGRGMNTPDNLTDIKARLDALEQKMSGIVFNPAEPNRPKRPSVKEIIVATEREYELLPDEILNVDERSRYFVRPRQVAMYLACRLTLRSLPEIGRQFGMDHSTVHHARKTITELRRNNGPLNEKISAIERIFSDKEKAS